MSKEKKTKVVHDVGWRHEHQRTCVRCGHTWVPRKEITIVCPNCLSPYWNIPRHKKKEES